MFLETLRERIPERYRKLVRFTISGGTGFLVNLVVLIALVELTGMRPVVASVGAFVCAFGVSFTLQKFWTFKDAGLTEAPQQATRYLVVALVNLALNALLMYLFTEVLHLFDALLPQYGYIAAQIVTNGLIAIESYFLYKHFVFSKPVHARAQ
jgi:putative flippase GtrA